MNTSQLGCTGTQESRFSMYLGVGVTFWYSKERNKGRKKHFGLFEK